MSSTLPDHHRLTIVERDIGHHGVHVAIDPVDGSAYTVGHSALHDLPELLLRGAPPVRAEAVLTAASERMRGGWATPSDPGRHVDLGGHLVRLVHRRSDELDDSTLPLARRYAELLRPGAVIDVVEVTLAEGRSWRLAS